MVVNRHASTPGWEKYLFTQTGRAYNFPELLVDDPLVSKKGTSTIKVIVKLAAPDFIIGLFFVVRYKKDS